MSQDAMRIGKLQFCKGRIKQKTSHLALTGQIAQATFMELSAVLTLFMQIRAFIMVR